MVDWLRLLHRRPGARIAGNVVHELGDYRPAGVDWPGKLSAHAGRSPLLSGSLQHGLHQPALRATPAHTRPSGRARAQRKATRSKLLPNGVLPSVPDAARRERPPLALD